MNKPTVADELDAALEAKVTALKKAFRKGEADEALRLADEVWEQLPEPRSNWDYYSQVVPLRAASGAIDSGHLDKAATWLERAYEGYAPLNDASQQLLDFVKAKLMYRAGRKDVAFAYFDAIYKASGRRPFTDEPDEYWDFYQQAAKSGEYQSPSLLAGGAEDVVPPVGSGRGADDVELSDELHERVVALFEEGSNYEDLNAPAEAVRCHSEAARLLPEPRTQWEAATLVYTALGDALLELTRVEEAERALQIALQSPGGTGNGYVWLRLGQAQHQLGRARDALESWTSAYALEGKELFEDEDDAWTALVAAGIPTQ